MKPITVLRTSFNLFIFLIFLNACRNMVEEFIPTSEPIGQSEMELLDIDENFDFVTVQSTELQIEVRSNADVSLPNVPVDIYQGNPETNGSIIASSTTNAQGKITLELSLPSSLDSIYLYTNYIGLPPLHAVKIEPIITNYTIGGASENPTGSGRTSRKHGFDKNDRFFENGYTFWGEFNGNGVPKYLEEQDDQIPASVLETVNASLPEGFPVPTFNPQYLEEGIISNVVFSDSADLWITFVHEGAGWRNALGYYTYPSNQPPASAEEIDSLYVIFPNVSYKGGGKSGLQSGNKVYLGKFGPNTTVAWFLVPNGWNGRTVTQKNEIKYSDKTFNTFTSSEYQNHIVLLEDLANELLLIGIEDQSRPGGDNDFNDAVFYVTANPFSSVTKTQLAKAKPTRDDSDEDGVFDVEDHYPNDPNRAFNLYFPAQDTYGTLAFEDLWPAKGDYDFNDLVVDYNHHLVVNAQNEAVEMNTRLIVRAVGASFHNGFAFQLGINPAQVQSVTGSRLGQGYINLNGNGTEAGQSQAVIVAFDDAYDIMQRPGGFFVNTENEGPRVEDQAVDLSIRFSSPVGLRQLGDTPFNPFLIVNRQRGYEVHLKGMPPTDLADPALFGSLQDRTNLNTGNSYQTEKHLPFALHVPISFDYPLEKKAIISAYQRFGVWAESGGTIFQDWYLPLTGYRQEENIYTK